jgi:cyclic-di-GMP-binding protein
MMIPDLASGVAFLSRLPLSSPLIAHPSLAEFIESLIESPPPFQVFVQLLEHARVPLEKLQLEVSRVFLGKAVPLGENEENAFQQVFRGWQRMARAYARCAQLDSGEDADYATRVATILQRCIRYAGLGITEHFRVRRELPSGLWLDFYGYYDSAEEWEIANLVVFEPLDRTRQTSTCTSELVSVLLTELAGPYTFSVNDIDRIVVWARLWSPMVGVIPLKGDESGPLYSIDLVKDFGIRLQRHESHSASARRLDTVQLAGKIESVSSQLAQKISPSRLGLGEVLSAEARALLDELSRPWAQIASPRRFRRRPAQGEALVASGFDNLHYLIAGKDFTQPDSGNVYSRKEFDMLFVFRQRVDPTQQFFVDRGIRDVPADRWEIINQSAAGYRLIRRLAGQRVMHKQLIVVRPPEHQHFLLAQAHWLMQERSQSLAAGVEVLPGVPEAVAVRAPAQGGGDYNGRFEVAFLLPEVPAMNADASLLLQSGVFQQGRILELYTTTVWRVRLTGLIQRGSDFDRVSYVLAT